eukprot:180395_1
MKAVPNQIVRIATASFCALQLTFKERMYSKRDSHMDRQEFHGSLRNSLKQNDYRFYGCTVTGWGCCVLAIVNSSTILTGALCGILGSMFGQTHYLKQKDKLLESSSPKNRQFVNVDTS